MTLAWVMPESKTATKENEMPQTTFTGGCFCGGVFQVHSQWRSPKFLSVVATNARQLYAPGMPAIMVKPMLWLGTKGGSLLATTTRFQRRNVSLINFASSAEAPCRGWCRSWVWWLFLPADWIACLILNLKHEYSGILALTGRVQQVVCPLLRNIQKPNGSARHPRLRRGILFAYVEFFRGLAQSPEGCVIVPVV